MKKYVVLITISFLFIAGLATCVFIWLNTKGSKSADSILAIPINSSVIVRIDDFAKFKNSLSQSNAWESVATANGIDGFYSVVSFADSLYTSNSLIKKLLTGNHFHFAFCPDNGSKTAILLSTKIPEEVAIADLYSLAKLQSIGIYTDEEEYYNNALILTLKQGEAEFKNISLTCYRGLLIMSNSKVLVEKSVAQIDEGVSLLNNSQFVDIAKTAGSKVNANIYINLTYFPMLVKHLLNDNYRKEVNTLCDVAQWVELDLNLAKNSLVMTGLATVSDSSNSYLRILTRQKPVDIEMFSTLPAETGLLVWLGVSNLDEYLEDYRSYLDKKGEIFKYTQSLSNCQKLIGTEVQDYFKTIVDEEIGVALIPSTGSNLSNDWYIIARTKSASSTAQYLQNISLNVSRESKVAPPAKPAAISIDKEKSIEIHRQPLLGLHKLLFGNLFSSISDEYYCFFDNWIIWGSSPESLQRYINSNIRNTVLKNDGTYQQFNAELPQRANYYVYINPKLIGNVANAVLSPSANFKASMPSIQGISYQLIGGNSLIFNTLTLISGTKAQDISQNSIWETKLDADPTAKPQIVVNHTSKEKEIFTQDSDHNIYLINSIGRILWKKKIDGTIIGEVTQVDLFKNKKLQYAFNTANKLYLVDRNGKDVQGFPILYAATATNPVSVIDYDGNRNYRFFQACSNRKIYAFDSAGKTISGWKFNKTETLVTDKVEFVRISGLDYIAVFDSNRLYLLNRKGEERVKFSNYFSKAPNSTFALGANSKGVSYLVTTDTIGLVRNIYFDGHIESIALQPFSKWHSFIYNDLNNDGKKDYIILDNNTLCAFDNNKNLLFQLKIKDELKPEILFFDFGSDNEIGVVSEKSGKIYLVNSKGKVDDGFPYNGSTSFSITRLNKSNNMSIIVGSKQGTLINYGLGK